MKSLLLLLSIVMSPLAHSELYSPSQVQLMTNTGLVASGQATFQRHCSGCHGVNADGQGLGAAMLDPKPRNLLQDSFKLRSTPSGVLPTSEDLLRTIENGIPGSSMPSFRELSSQEKLALVAFIRSLRPQFKETLDQQSSMAFSAPPVEIFHQKVGLLAAASRGKKIYDKSCVFCHGAQGLGDGPSAADLTDENDRPIKAANLTSLTFKSGASPKDIFRAFSTGLDGTPMPSFIDNFSDKDRWDIVAYVFYLRGMAHGVYSIEDKLP